MIRSGWMVLGGVALGAVLVARAGAHDEGFCHKATQWSDMMVCGNPNLANLDSQVDAAYQRKADSLPAKEAGEVREVQDEWLRGREKCQEDSDPTKCLERYYQRHIEEITATKPNND